MPKIPENNKYNYRKFKNIKNKLLINYFMKEAGNDNKKIKKTINEVLNKLINLNIKN